MLTDDLRAAVKNMKKLDAVESAIQDAEKRAKNDSDFSALVTDFLNTTKKISDANKKMGFDVSEETIQYLEEEVQKLETVVSTSVVDEAELASAKQHLSKKVSPGLTKEWKDFHQKKTAGLAAKLSSLGGLVQDTTQIARIKLRLSNGADWTNLSLMDDGQHTRLELLTEGIRQVDQLEQGLNLSDEVKDFVVLVTSGKARLTDVNPAILDWIKKEKLVDKFVITFSNSRL